MAIKTRSLNFINKVIVHCSNSDDKDADRIDVIRKWHLLRGWDDVGYHFFIRKDGTIEAGRPLTQYGAHCIGQNSTSIGVCLSGKEDFGHEQFFALGSIYQVLCIELNKDLPIYPHRDFNANKTCPNFDLNMFDKYILPSDATTSQEK
jgi:hypothetical protein